MSFLVSSCAGPQPILDLDLTKSALEAAKSAEASRYAPKLWIQAENEYRKALEFYKKQNHHKAKKALMRSKKWAEQAELESRIKKSQSGDLSF